MGVGEYGSRGEAMSEQANRVEESGAEKRAQDSKASHTPPLPHSLTPSLSY
jgi:hypothetical protein